MNWGKILRILNIIILTVSLAACTATAPNYENRPLNSGSDISAEMTSKNLYNMAQSLYDRRDYMGAYNLYGRAFIGADGDTALQNDIEIGRANCLLRLDRVEDALLSFNALNERGLSTLEVQVGMVESHLRLGNIAQARVQLLSLQQDGQASVHIYTLQGILYDLDLKHELARLSYESAMELDADISTSITNLALSYALTEDFETSQALLNSIETSEDTKALLYALEGKLDKAEELITRAFFRRGLGATAVAQNMRYYEKLAELSASDRAKAVLLGIVDEN